MQFIQNPGGRQVAATRTLSASSSLWACSRFNSSRRKIVPSPGTGSTCNVQSTSRHGLHTACSKAPCKEEDHWIEAMCQYTGARLECSWLIPLAEFFLFRLRTGAKLPQRAPHRCLQPCCSAVKQPPAQRSARRNEKPDLDIWNLDLTAAPGLLNAHCQGHRKRRNEDGLYQRGTCAEPRSHPSH